MTEMKITTEREALASAKVDGYSLRIVTEDEDEDAGGNTSKETTGETAEAATIDPDEVRRKVKALLAERKEFPYDVPVEKWQDRGFCLDAIGRHKKSIHLVSKNFWHDKGFCIEAIRISQSEKTLRYIDHSFWRDREFCLEVIRVSEPSGMGYLEDTPMDYFHSSLWKDGDFCLAAVRLKGDMLQYVHKEKLTPQLRKAAMSKNDRRNREVQA